MKLHTFVALPLITLFARTGYAAADLCLGACSTPADGTKECTFTVKLDLHASELGYFHFEECDGVNPTLGEYTFNLLGRVQIKP